eukprot:gb/GECG01002768.1/.p1 GENE.gb/GECG01002768.1/~~gb/GECG01002768.1/.p1  ORF type:complete len:965 (+),score=179.31 gb/GECG01002768.1/:1-2895(+)
MSASNTSSSTSISSEYSALDSAIQHELHQNTQGEATGHGAVIDPLFQQIIQTTKAANKLKKSFTKHDNDDDNDDEQEQVANEILDTVSHLMNQFKPSSGASTIQEYAERCHESEGFDHVRDILDLMLEAADFYLDQAKGHDVNKQVSMVQEQLLSAARSSTPNGKKSGSSGKKQQSLQQAIESSQHVDKPQDYFRDAPVDNRRLPFIPKLQSNAEKYNALQPLKSWTVPDVQEGDEWESAPHPYEYEIQEFMRSGYPERMTQKVTERPFQTMEDTELEDVTTVNKVHEMLEELEDRNVQEIAIDLEAHSLRTFQGFVCLMQVSTRGKDYLVDTLVLREHMHVLNRVFTDPTKVKVLHGCDSDVVWLQRDFGLYLVNVFDTGQAARVLGYKSLGLAYLLETFCNIDVDKSHQLADWRQRPLPEELRTYARQDTHYLLDIMDRLKNLIIQKDHGKTTLLTQVLDASNKLTLKRYEKEQFREDDWKNLAVKLGLQIPPEMLGASNGNDSSSSASASSPSRGIRSAHPQQLSNEQARVFAALFEWRDRMAREEDESVQYTLSRRALVRLSREMPTSMRELSKCCNPLPPLVRKHSSELLITIRKAKQNESTMTVPRYRARTSATEKCHNGDGNVVSGNSRKQEAPQSGRHGASVAKQVINPTIVKGEDASRGRKETTALIDTHHLFPDIETAPTHNRLYVPKISAGEGTDAVQSNTHVTFLRSPAGSRGMVDIFQSPSSPSKQEDCRAQEIRQELASKNLFSFTVPFVQDTADSDEDEEIEGTEETGSSKSLEHSDHAGEASGNSDKVSHFLNGKVNTNEDSEEDDNVEDAEKQASSGMQNEEETDLPQSLVSQYNLNSRGKKKRARRKKNQKRIRETGNDSASQQSKNQSTEQETPEQLSSSSNIVADSAKVNHLLGGAESLSAKSVRDAGKSRKLNNVYTVGGVEKTQNKSSKKAKRGKKNQRRAK